MFAGHELPQDQLLVDSSPGQELVMCALFHHQTLVNHYHLREGGGRDGGTEVGTEGRGWEGDREGGRERRWEGEGGREGWRVGGEGGKVRGGGREEGEREGGRERERGWVGGREGVSAS